MNTCSQAEALRDFAFDELGAGERQSMERHLSGCAECAAELDQLRVTTAALRALPDREISQRIAFVSDKVFSPSPAVRFFGSIWNSTARLGFLSACAVAVALIVSAYHRPAEIRTIVQTTQTSPEAPKSIDLSGPINEAVAKAVAQARVEDAQRTRELLATVNRGRQQDRQAFIEMVSVIQNRANTHTLLASYDGREAGAGQ